MAQGPPVDEQVLRLQTPGLDSDVFLLISDQAEFMIVLLGSCQIRPTQAVEQILLILTQTTL